MQPPNKKAKHSPTKKETKSTSKGEGILRQAGYTDAFQFLDSNDLDSILLTNKNIGNEFEKKKNFCVVKKEVKDAKGKVKNVVDTIPTLEKCGRILRGEDPREKCTAYCLSNLAKVFRNSILTALRVDTVDSQELCFRFMPTDEKKSKIHLFQLNMRARIGEKTGITYLEQNGVDIVMRDNLKDPDLKTIEADPAIRGVLGLIDLKPIRSLSEKIGAVFMTPNPDRGYLGYDSDWRYLMLCLLKTAGSDNTLQIYIEPGDIPTVSFVQRRIATRQRNLAEERLRAIFGKGTIIEHVYNDHHRSEISEMARIRAAEQEAALPQQT